MIRRPFVLSLLSFAVAAAVLGQSAQPFFDRLSKLRDVQLVNLLDAQVLTYDLASGKWKNAAGGSGGGISLVGENYLSLAGTVLTANAVNLGGSNATGTLAAGREPAHTGDVTNSAGSLTLTLGNIPDLVTQAGSIKATNIAAPATPGLGQNKFYFDSTSKNLAAKNDAGTVNHGIQSRTATASNWIRSILDDGTTTISQPDFSDLPGSATDAQIPNVLTLTKISNLTSNGFVKTGSGDGTLSIDTSVYLTGNQSITISGDASGTGTTAITLALGNIPNLTTQAGSILATNIASPATPAAGKTKVYVDSTSKNIAALNDAGTINHGVQTLASTSGKFVNALNDAGELSVVSLVTGDIPALGGNPSVNVTLSAQNGTATTYLRSDGAPALSQAISPVWTAAHIWTISDAIAGAVTIATLNHDTSLTPAISDGSAIVLGAKSSTTNDRAQVRIESHWSDVTDATRTSYFAIANVSGGVGPTTDRFYVFGDGGSSLYTKQDSGAGIFYSEFGFQTRGLTPPGSGLFMQSDGTAYINSIYKFPTAVGAAGNSFVSNGTDVVSKASGGMASVTATVDQTATTETVHVTYTAPANSAAIGTTYRISAWGNCDNPVTTAITFTPIVRWGGSAGVTLQSGPAFVASTTANTNRQWSYVSLVTIRTIGATGTAFTSVDHLIERSTSATGVPNVLETNSGATGTTIDTTANKDLVLDWTLSSTTGTPHLRTIGGTIEVVKP